MSNAARLRAAADPVEAHREAFQEAYDRLPDSMAEADKVRWAERQASNPLLRMALSPRGPVLAGKFGAADYTDDGLKPESKR